MPFLVTVRLNASLGTDASAVDQDIETAEALDGAATTARDGSVVSDVGFGVLDADRGSGHVQDGYPGPLGRQQLGRPQPYPRRPSCDQGSFAREIAIAHK